MGDFKFSVLRGQRTEDRGQGTGARRGQEGTGMVRLLAFEELLHFYDFLVEACFLVPEVILDLVPVLLL